MDQLPHLPSEISPDGREIWGWAGKFSEHVHRLDRINRLSSDIRLIGTRCGDCDKWMKSSSCPKERNVNGRTTGPSSETIKCSNYVESRSATNRRAELEAKLELEQQKGSE